MEKRPYIKLDNLSSEEKKQRKNDQKNKANLRLISRRKAESLGISSDQPKLIRDPLLSLEDRKKRKAEQNKLYRLNMSEEDRERERERSRLRIQKKRPKKEELVLTTENIYKLLYSKYSNINIHYLKRYMILISSDYSRYSCKMVKHHILPRSLFRKYKSNKKNIVRLPVKAHLLVHHVLSKMWPENRKMATAYCFMTDLINGKKTGKDYQYSQNLNNQARKEIQINRILKGNHCFTGENSISKQRAEKGLHYNSNKKPWKNSNSNELSKKCWSFSDIYYEIFLENTSIGEGKLITLCKKKNIFVPTAQVSHNLILYFRKGWVPTSDCEWNIFKNTYKERIINE